MKNLCVDIGNSRCKLGLFQENKLIEQAIFQNNNTDKILEFIAILDFQKSILSNVYEHQYEIEQYLNLHSTLHKVNTDSKFPFYINYISKSIGHDRLAALAGAQHLFPQQNVLVVNAGSCITLDALVDNTFIGGNISPGMKMRWRAMDEFTARLPLVTQADMGNEFLGNTTETAMANGVVFAVLAEINYYYTTLKLKYSDILCVLTGGDADFLVKRLSFQTFAEPNLVLFGLNNILNYQ